MIELNHFQQYLSERHATRTARAYGGDLADFVAYCEGEYGEPFSAAMFNHSDLHDYQVHCRQVGQVSAATWNRRAASLKVFSKWLRQTGQIENDPTDVLNPAEGQELAPKSLTESEYRRFRLAVTKAVVAARSDAAKVKALRDQAVITLMMDAGLREGEVVNLRRLNLLLGERKGKVVVRSTKGNKDRSIPLDKDSVDKLKAYLALVNGDALFLGKHGELLQERGIQKMVKQYGKAAGVEVTPHVLRHTAGYRWLKAGANLVEVAALLGHSSLEVTRRYTLPHYEDLEKVVEVA